MTTHYVRSFKQSKKLRQKSRAKSLMQQRELRNAQAQGYAKLMREKPTPEELIVCEMLNDKGIQYEFQKVFFNHEKAYIVDFYIKTVDRKKYAIEIDGFGHRYHKKNKDQERTEWLKKNFQIDVVRFWNSEVLQNSTMVIEEIERLYPRHSIIPKMPSFI